jgi:hypothetical protein
MKKGKEQSAADCSSLTCLFACVENEDNEKIVARVMYLLIVYNSL